MDRAGDVLLLKRGADVSTDLAKDKAVKVGEPWDQAVEKLYKAMYPALYVYAARVLENGGLAEEAIQEAFCIACAKRKQFLDSRNPHGWIMLTLKHVMQNMRRRQAKLKSVGPLEEGMCFEAEPSELMSIDLLFGDVSGSEDFRLLKRIALDRYTIVELSRELGVSVEACKKRVQRARKRLRQQLEL